ncbi:MAG: cytochrome c biogenesis CcdA family protein [Chitinispirillaceae bacterium]
MKSVYCFLTRQMRWVVPTLLIMLSPLSASEKLTLHFFGSSTCGECQEIKHSILFPARESHPDKIDLRIHDIDTDSGFNLMLDMEDSYGVKNSSSIELFFPDTFLTGGEEIQKNAGPLIDSYLENPQKWKSHEKSAHEGQQVHFSQRLSEKFKEFSFLSILLAGLVDGINPCAIATMIFLVSFLATKKRTQKEVLTIGLCFTGAVFITYLLLGIGAFRIITALEHYRWMSKGIRWTAVGFAGIVGLVSFGDAFRYRRSGKTQDIKLQLPKAIKLRIHKVISGNLSGSQLATGAIVTGFLVTLLEAVCTGQVYLPTIVLMTKQQGMRFIGWLYLVFYNFLFVVPLLIVMFLAYYGMKWDKLAKTTQKHLVAIKISFGVVLIALAAFLAIAG